MRKAGVLLPISSLPSPWGIGALGAAAREFIDFLAAAGQSFWQILPLGPTSYGDSPYQSFSSWAGNPYFIDLDDLAAEGLLERQEYQRLNWGEDPARVDYTKRAIPFCGRPAPGCWSGGMPASIPFVWARLTGWRTTPCLWP